MDKYPKTSTKNDTSIPYPPKATISRHQPKVNSVSFEYPYNQINNMENTNYDTHLIDYHE